MKQQLIVAALDHCFEGVDQSVIPAGTSLYKGKVRDVVSAARRVALIASDRISAFDRVLSAVPYKGEVLTRLSAWWFEQTVDIIGNHLLGPTELGGINPLQHSGRCVIAKRCQMLPVELVVRGYLTGSAWRDYQANRPVSGIELPRGLSYCEKFPVPLITPSTKEASGHDKPMSAGEIVASGLVDADLWQQVEKSALALFRRGQEIAAAQGLILVDTKYEFGLYEGKLILADEIHTSDSSRYWYADTYRERYASGVQQRELDKETFRRWLLDRGFSGDGTAPQIDDQIRLDTALRYIEAFEAITGREFIPVESSPDKAGGSLPPLLAQTLV